VCAEAGGGAGAGPVGTAAAAAAAAAAAPWAVVVAAAAAALGARVALRVSMGGGSVLFQAKAPFPPCRASLIRRGKVASAAREEGRLEDVVQ
jgi:hypothetical protein